MGAPLLDARGRRSRYLADRTCAFCGESFRPRLSRNRFCSHECGYKGRRRVRLADRFWAKVRKAGPDECWIWIGTRDGRGYGQISRGGVGDGIARAHRVAWELLVGPIPRGLFACHKCDNPLCVNPAHIFLGTHQDNMSDMSAKGRGSGRRKTHCPQGHEYSPENTYHFQNHRYCRACNREAVARSAQRRRAA